MSPNENNTWIFSDISRNLTGTGFSPKKDTYFIIFPHAGGSPSFYRNWTKLLPENYECWIALMPGRESRFSESPFQDIQEAVKEFYQSFSRLPEKRKLIVFGHSLGAILAFEFTRIIQKKYQYLPVLLAISGRSQPEHHDEKLKETLSLDDMSFFKKIALDYAGVNQEILNNSDYISLLAPILRADMEMSQNYRMMPGEILLCPIIAFCGNNDEGATSNEMINWKDYTAAKLHIVSCSGGHFFIIENTQYIINEITRYHSLYNNIES